MMGIATAIVVLGVLLVVGVAMVVAGLRGRKVDEHPVCRGCGFDLVGVFPGPERCPECGKALDEAAVRIGRRERRRAMLAAGAFLTSAMLLVLIGLGAATASGVNWNSYKPTGWLVRQAGAGTPADVHAAVDELSKRYSAGKLGDASIERVIATGLAFQADRAGTAWVPEWGDLIETMAADGHVGEQQLAVYWRQAFTITPRMQQKVRPGKPVAIMASTGTDRRGNSAPITYSVAIEQISVEGGRTSTRSPGVSAGYATSQGIGRGGSTSTQSTLSLKPGPNSVTITWSCTVAGPDVNPSISETYFSRWTIEKTFQVEVVPEPLPLVSWVSDADTARYLRENTSISRVAPQIDETSPSLYVSVRIESPPVAMAMDVLLSVEGQETHLFYLTQPAAQGPKDSGGVVRLDATPANGIIILRPSEDALGILEADEVFGEELRFPITISWPAEE